MASRKSLRLGYTVRGGGRIFTVIEGLDDSAGQILVHAITEDGVNVPCRVSTTSKGEKAAVVPVLGVPMTVTVRVCDSNGDTIGIARKKLDPRGAHIASGVNAKRDSDLAARLRGCDEEVLPGKPSMERVRALPVDDGAYGNPEGGAVQLWVLASYEARKDDMPGEGLVIDALGEDGKSLAVGECVTLGCATRDIPELPGCERRMEAVSLVIRRPSINACVTMSFADMPSTKTFFCLERHVIDAMEGGDRGLMLDPDVDPDYMQFFHATRASEIELEWQRNHPEHLDGGPMFSIVVPLFKTPQDFFFEMAESVLNQTYRNLELILVNASPEDERLRQDIKAIENTDQRVHVVELDANRGITRNTRAGVDMAHGDFICYFDHDDVLEPDILWQYAQAVVDDPTCDMIYCDEDKLKDGVYINPNLKPDFSMSFLESNNYLCHMLCVRRTLLDKISYPDESMDGAQDHAISLAVGEVARSVAHIPKVLYHWRIHEASTAGNAVQKPESVVAGRIALTQHLVRVDVAGYAADTHLAHTYDIIASSDHALQVGVVVLIRPNSRNRTPEKIESSIKAFSTWKNLRVVCEEVDEGIDNEGKDGLTRALTRALDRVGTPYTFVVDADATINLKDWIEFLLPHIAQERVGLVGACVTYRDGRIRSLGYHFDEFGFRRILNRYVPTWVGPRCVARLAHEVSALSGALIGGKTEVLSGLVAAYPTFVGTDWGLDMSLRARDDELDVVCAPLIRVTEDMDEFELRLDGRFDSADVATREAIAGGEVLKRWSYFFGMRDPYYSRWLTPDGGWRLDVRGAVER